jgi:isopentenyl phosphate kinase
LNSKYTFPFGLSVPASRKIRYCSGDKIFRHSSLDLSTDFVLVLLERADSVLCKGKKPDNKAKEITLIEVNKVTNFIFKNLNCFF